MVAFLNYLFAKAGQNISQDGACSYNIVVIPLIQDLDDSFAYYYGRKGPALMYYYDGEYFSEPPVSGVKFREYAVRHLPRIGIKIPDRLRLGITYSQGCPPQALDLAEVENRLTL